MVPPAPPTFSITTGWPSVGRIASAMMRAAVSVDPPGGNGTIRVTGRDGNVCASARLDTRSDAAANIRTIGFSSSRNPESTASVELGGEAALLQAQGDRNDFDAEVDPPDLAPVGRLHLHLPVPGLVVGLHAVAPETLLPAADDLDRDGVLQHPAASFRSAFVTVPAHQHLIGEARRREDAEVDMHLVAGLGAEPLVALVPEAPRRPLVAQLVAGIGALDAVVNAHVADGERHRRDPAEKVK